MKYYLDTEFLEGTQKRLFGVTKPTIDLISIGIVCEDGREYYAISKDFNLKEAWNRYDIKIEQVSGDMRNRYPEGIKHKVYWIRDNVLKPIFIELRAKEVEEYNIAKRRNVILDFPTYSFSYKNFKRLINKYGKTNKQIAKEIKHFVANRHIEANKEQWILDYDTKDVHFYGYYGDYDWVVFCWLFGKMIDLPKGFPMYCIDLKQELVRKQSEIKGDAVEIDRRDNYPKQINEHNALADAKWTKQLHDFLNKL